MPYTIRYRKVRRAMRSKNDYVSQYSKNKNLRVGRRRTFVGLPAQMARSIPFKRSMYCRLPYSESLTNMTSGLIGVFGTENVYRLGSIFDPNFAVGGHQPIGRDILAQIYNKYKVYGVTVDLHWSDAGGDGGICGVMINSSSDSTTLAGMSAETAVEKPNVFRGFVNDTGNQQWHFKKYFDLGKIEGLTSSQFKNDIQQYCAGMGTDPTLTPYLRLSVANIAQTSGIKVHCDVKLTYHVKFYDPITLAKS